MLLECIITLDVDSKQLKERAEKLELWRARELQREKKKAEQKELLLRQSSMWVAEEKSEKRILDAITAITAL